MTGRGCKPILEVLTSRMDETSDPIGVVDVVIDREPFTSYLKTFLIAENKN